VSAVITLKQLEAFYWIVELGTFERAAKKLNSTQSAISKRIQELELATGIVAFDRSRRGTRLTEKGAHLLAIGQEMLELQQRIADLHNPSEQLGGNLRLGVTELTSLTWFPRVVAELRSTFPRLQLRPEIDMSRNLHEKLRNDELDIIVIPEIYSDPDILSVRVAEVHNSWMANPNLIASGRTLTLEDLSKYTILRQIGGSGTGVYFDRWLKSQRVKFQNELSANSLIALVGLTLANIGVSYLPRECFQPLVAGKKLRIIPTVPLLPPVPYAVMYHRNRQLHFSAGISELIQKSCDFSIQYHR
jgi:DNA-binding transcriptional LysR family regulator